MEHRRVFPLQRQFVCALQVGNPRITDGTGVFDPAGSVFKLRDSLSAGGSNYQFAFGPAGSIPLAGNWDGRGGDGIGVYDPLHFTFKLRNSPSAGPADYVFAFGYAGVKPIVGNWDGTGGDGIGIFDTHGTFKLRDSPSAGG